MRALVMVLVLAACREPEYSGPTIQITGSLMEYRHVGYRPPVPDVDVCVYDEPSLVCATSDVNGAFSLRAPVGEIALVYRAETFVTEVQVLTTKLGEDMTVGFNMLPLNEERLLAATAGVTLEPGTGIAYFDLQFHFGAAATIEPAAGLGPIYHDGEGIPDRSLVATTENGDGEFVNLPPGEYTVRFHQLNTTFAVVPPIGWPVESGSRMPILADALTSVTFHAE